jgi:hypothetical protein
MRELAITLPSASEYACWNTCQAKWAFSYRCGIAVREKGVRLLTGSALSEAMEQFYLPSSERTPYEIFDKFMYDARRMHETCPEEEWQAAFSEAREVLELYLASYKADRFGKVLAVQKKIDKPCPMKLDLVVQDDATGEIYPVEQKSVSGWADITYENLKYDMDPQPILYSLGIVSNYQVECKKVVIDYLIKPIPAKGKYKAKPAGLAEYTVAVPLWKQDMIYSGLLNANDEMMTLDEQLDNIKLEAVPRRTNNCVLKFGSKTFLCDYYEACSSNVNPLELPGFQGRD